MCFNWCTTHIKRYSQDNGTHQISHLSPYVLHASVVGWLHDLAKRIWGSNVPSYENPACDAAAGFSFAETT